MRSVSFCIFPRINPTTNYVTATLRWFFEGRSCGDFLWRKFHSRFDRQSCSMSREGDRHPLEETRPTRSRLPLIEPSAIDVFRSSMERCYIKQRRMNGPLSSPVAIQLSLIWSGLRYHRPAAKNVSDSITSPQTDARGNFVAKNHSILGRNNETWSLIHLRPFIRQDSWRNFGELLHLVKFYFRMHRICVFFSFYRTHDSFRRV